MSRTTRGPVRFRKSLLALAIGTALAPYTASALDLAQAPPGTTQPYVRPNVIISIDDSGSMNYRLDVENAGGATNNTTPNADETWPMTSRRMNVLKYSLAKVFNDTTLLPEKKIRLAWQAMNANNGTPGTLTIGATNSMKVLTDGATGHRANFLTFVNNLSPSGSTPAHKPFRQADTFMREPLSQDGPWAATPGSQGAPYLACRRNYHIMMTDGRWNGDVSGGSQDDNTVNRTLPDGTVYGTVYGSTNPALRPNNKLYHDTYSNTLADWAFRSWADPLQTAGLTGAMQPGVDYRKAPATESFGTDAIGQPAVLDRYWNPRYNPATWPHMVTYTIGFSNMAITWPGAPSIIAPTEKVPFGYNGSFPDLVTGNRSWPQMTSEDRRALDLWHAALNGRGRFYAVTKGEDLEKAFREIFGQINTETENELMATAASGSNSSRNDVAKFTASYEPKNLWKGSVVSELVKTDGSTVANPGWGGKNTADKLDDLANVTNRLILSWGDKWLGLAGQPYQGGVPFKWIAGDTNLSTLQKTMLGTVPGITGYTVASSGENILNYVRGDRSLEGSEATGYTTAKPFRERKSRQGDIVNSQVWYTGAPSSNYALKGYSAFTRAYKSRTPMIYVGGNDGMLHGFSATDGSEKLAYVPRGVIPSLKKITEPAFNSTHKYFVDGSPMTGDVDMGVGIQAPDDPGYTDTYAPNWRTLLVGTLGAGGKGYFVLDVTDPSGTINATDSFAESNAQNRVLIDRTRGSSETVSCATLTGAEKLACDQAVLEGQDIGSITAQPVLDDNNPMRTTQITRMNNNRWAAVLGNGYNSTNQRPVLLVQYLDGAKELLRIPTVGTAAVAPTPGTGIANDNGLAAPRLMDINGDGRPDVAYAGDNLGNMWKFDLTSITDTQWKVAFSGHPLFTATGPASLSSTARNKVQPITIPPTVRANDRTKTVGTPPITLPVGGVMVAFGTGRNLTTDDAANVDVQTLYSVLDNTRYRTVTTALGKRLEVHPGGGTCPNGTDCVPAPAYLGTGVVTAKLAQQKITELASGDLGTVDAVTALNKSTWDNYNGWYMDFPSVGERQLKPFEFYDGSNILAVYSQVPAKGSDVDPNVETCESNTVDEERQYRTFINVMDGARPSIQIVDANSDGAFNSADNGVSRKRVRKGSHRLISKNKTTMLDVDVKNDKENLARMPERSLRPSWRQMK